MDSRASTMRMRACVSSNGFTCPSSVRWLASASGFFIGVTSVLLSSNIPVFLSGVILLLVMSEPGRKVGFFVYSDCFTMMTFSTSLVEATVMMALSFSSSLRWRAHRSRNAASSRMLALSASGLIGLCRRFRGFVGLGCAGVLYAGAMCAPWYAW